MSSSMILTALCSANIFIFGGKNNWFYSRVWISLLHFYTEEAKQLQWISNISLCYFVTAHIWNGKRREICRYQISVILLLFGLQEVISWHHKYSVWYVTHIHKDIVLLLFRMDNPCDSQSPFPAQPQFDIPNCSFLPP